jgi:large subunit ribosomal protein L9
MKVILRSDLDGVGKKGDVLDVADGYARNYLLPRGMALRATEGAVGQAQAMRRSRDVKDARERGAAEEIARQLVPKVISLTARAGAGGRLFGSVTASDVADAVLAQTGIELDRRKMHLDEPIREVGTHRVTVRLHTDVVFPVTVEVSPDAATA